MGKFFDDIVGPPTLTCCYCISETECKIVICLHFGDKQSIEDCSSYLVALRRSHTPVYNDTRDLLYYFVAV